MEFDGKAIGKRIQFYRNEKELSQKDLADLVSTTSKHISNIEIGFRTPGLDLLVLIANALDVTANDLLADNLTHNVSDTDKELHEIFFDCNKDEKSILMKTLTFLKALLSEHGI